MKTKLCTVCKIAKTLDQFYKSKKYGCRFECKDCGRDATKRYRLLSSTKILRASYQKKRMSTLHGKICAKNYASSLEGRIAQKKSRTSPKQRYVCLKSGAKRRGLELTLSFIDFAIIISNPCFYCNGYFNKVMTGSGLDRINNDIGYTLTNVVSCCKTCNWIKSDFLSQEETLAAIKAIISVREINRKNKEKQNEFI